MHVEARGLPVGVRSTIDSKNQTRVARVLLPTETLRQHGYLPVSVSQYLSLLDLLVLCVCMCERAQMTGVRGGYQIPWS